MTSANNPDPEFLVSSSQLEIADVRLFALVSHVFETHPILRLVCKNHEGSRMLETHCSFQEKHWRLK